MRRMGVLTIILLIAALGLIPWERSASIAPSAVPNDRTLSFRVVFGEKQVRP